MSSLSSDLEGFDLRKLVIVKASVFSLIVFLIAGWFLSSNSIGVHYNTRVVSNLSAWEQTLILPTDKERIGTVVPADDPYWEFDFWVQNLNYHALSAARDVGDGLYGELTVTSGGTINFFICDQENYDLYSSLQAANVYELNPAVGSLEWTFRVFRSDTWYLVYDNVDSLLTQKHVVGYNSIDITAPVIDMNLDSGSTYSGTKEVTATVLDEVFSVSEVRLDIDGTQVDEENDGSFSYSWDTTKYTDGEHTIRITASDNVGNTDYIEVAVRVSNVNYMAILAIGAIGCFVLVGVAVYRQRARKSETIVPTTVIEPGPTITDEAITPSQRVHIPEMQRPAGFCPFCGSPRDPPGAKFCRNCGGQLEN